MARGGGPETNGMTHNAPKTLGCRAAATIREQDLTYRALVPEFELSAMQKEHVSTV